MDCRSEYRKIVIVVNLDQGQYRTVYMVLPHKTK